MKDTILNLYSLLAVVNIHLPPFPHHGLSCDHVVRASAYNWRNTPSELCDVHSQSQGRCWYFRTALETLSTQIGGDWSASRTKRDYWTFWESEFDSGSTSNVFNNPGFDIMIATISWRQMHKTIIFCLNFARQLQTNNEQTRTQNRPTCWQAG